jgi:hypothetical protein
MEASDNTAPKPPTSPRGTTDPVVRDAEATEYFSPGSLALAITSVILGVWFGVVAVVLMVSAGWPGLPPLMLSVALFVLASRQIKKNEPASSP